MVRFILVSLKTGHFKPPCFRVTFSSQLHGQAEVGESVTEERSIRLSWEIICVVSSHISSFHLPSKSCTYILWRGLVQKDGKLSYPYLMSYHGNLNDLQRLRLRAPSPHLLRETEALIPLGRTLFISTVYRPRLGIMWLLGRRGGTVGKEPYHASSR